jgi:Protein of unknown function (DUF1759)
MDQKFTRMKSSIQAKITMLKSRASAYNQNEKKTEKLQESKNQPHAVLLMRLEDLTEKLSETEDSLPRFSGAHEHWKPFWNVFGEVVHSGPDLSETEKMLYLLDLIQKPALSAIKHLTPNKDGYNTAVELLQETYDAPHVNVLNLYKKIFSLPNNISQYSLQQAVLLV